MLWQSDENQAKTLERVFKNVLTIRVKKVICSTPHSTTCIFYVPCLPLKYLFCIKKVWQTLAILDSLSLVRFYGNFMLIWKYWMKWWNVNKIILKSAPYLSSQLLITKTFTRLRSKQQVRVEMVLISNGECFFIFCPKTNDSNISPFCEIEQPA